MENVNLKVWYCNEIWYCLDFKHGEVDKFNVTQDTNGEKMLPIVQDNSTRRVFIGEVLAYEWL